LCIQRAIRLANLSTDHSNALEMLHNEMSKAYLHHSFVYGQESTYCVVHVLLAVLYYKSGHYQSAIDHCKQVLNQDREQFDSPCIGAEYLPQIDEHVDTVFGLVLFYQHVQRNTLNFDDKLHPVTAVLPAFTTRLLAHYIYSKCSTDLTTKAKHVTMCQRRLLWTTESLLCDILLLKVMEIQLRECTETSVEEDIGCDDVGNNTTSSMDTTLLVESLELAALEKLITVRQAMVRELHSEQFPVVDEFEVLYAYKRGLFEECMELCRRGIRKWLHTDNSQLYWVAIPGLLSLLDGELVSVFGIIQLWRPNSISDVLRCTYIHTLTVFLYLLVRCQIKLRSDSLHDTMNLICFVHDKWSSAKIDFDRLILKLTYRLLILHMKTLTLL